MPRGCEVCGKIAVRGNQVTTRGKAKYLGGVGTKVTGISRREFKPNLQNLRVTVGKSNKTLRVCTQCIRSGAVTKRVRNAPFKLPASATKTEAAKGPVGNKPASKPAAPKTAAKPAPKSGK